MKIYLFLILFPSYCISSDATDYAAHKSTLTIFVRKSASFEDNSSAIAQLQLRLEKIIGKLKNDLRPSANLNTLLPEQGADMIDGLDFMFDNGTVFVTTRDILRATNKEFNSLSSNRKSLRFISQATDSSVASNWAIQLVSNGNATQSGALLVSRGQDLVPAPPNSLIVFLNTKTRVYLYEEQIVLKRQVYCEALFDYRNALATLSKYAYCFDKRLPKLVRKKYIAKSRKILEMLVSEQNAYEIKQLNN